ncbi:MAG TPA: hypothetical protein VGL12_06815 [Roseiarcus sp.]|jgi:hypothetical protein
MGEDLRERAQRILDILGETNIGAAGGALGLAAVSLLTEVSNSDFENWIKALRDARQHQTADRRAARQLRNWVTPEAMRKWSEERGPRPVRLGRPTRV